MSSRMQTEIERKYDVDGDAVLPELDGLAELAEAGIEVAARDEPVSLRATYFDTPDRALRRGRITLRRREGGHDEGWHVKLPAAIGRTELHQPLTPGGTVPREVRAPVRAFVRDEQLDQVATLATTRTIVRLLDKNADLVVEIADDLVESADLTTGIEQRWREWEVELGPAAPADDDSRDALFAAIEGALVEAGAQPASSVSKLARATGGNAAPARSGALDAERYPAAAAAVTVLDDLVGALLAAESGVRIGADDAVHRMRVVTRRLRSALVSARLVLDRERLDPLRAELARLAGVLGVPRDAEVLRDRAAGLFAELDAGAGSSPGASASSGSTGDTAPGARLDRTLAARYETGFVQVVVELDGRRHLELIGALDALLADPPLTERAGRPERSAAWFARRAVRTERRRVAAALAAGDDTAAAEAGEPGEARHELRKAAKRLRYVAEAVASVPALSSTEAREITKLGSRAEAVADALGEERDSAALQALVLATAEIVASDGGDDTAYLAAHTLENEREIEAAKEAVTAIRRLSKRL